MMKTLADDRIARMGITFLLAGAMALGGVAGVPRGAFADDPADLKAALDAASAKLDAIYGKAAAANEELNGTRLALEDTERDIAQAESDIAARRDELMAAQGNLSERVVDGYKGGGFSLLSMFLGSSSFDEMMTRVTYANKMAAADQRAISNVRRIQGELAARKGDLESKRREQQRLLAEQEDRAQELGAQVSEAESYVDSLDSQVRAALDAQRAEEARREQEEAQSVMGGGSQGGPASGGTAPQPTPPAPPGSGELSSEQRQIVVDAALSMVGGRYVFGGYDPANRTFDCSGLVQYCYAQVGVKLDHYTESQKKYCTKSISEARPGDIVYRRNHTGIYIGNGRTVEAHSPAEGIGWGSASRFASCGSPLP